MEEAWYAGILEIRASLEKLPEVEQQLREFEAGYKGRVRPELQREAGRRAAEIGSGTSDISGCVFGLAWLAGIGMAIMSFLEHGSRVTYLLKNPNAGGVGDMLGALFALVVVPVVLGAITLGVLMAVGGIVKGIYGASQAQAKSRKARISAAFTEDEASLVCRTVYRPPTGLFSDAPQWATGRHR